MLTLLWEYASAELAHLLSAEESGLERDSIILIFNYYAEEIISFWFDKNELQSLIQKKRVNTRNDIREAAIKWVW